MIQMCRSVQVAPGCDEAFARVADFSMMPRWDPGVLSAETLTDGPTGIGTRIRLQVRFGGRLVPMIYEVRSWVPGQHAVLEGQDVGGDVLARDDIRFVPRDGGTQIDWHASLELRHLGWFAEQLMRPVFWYYAGRTMRHLSSAL